MSFGAREIYLIILLSVITIFFAVWLYRMKFLQPNENKMISSSMVKGPVLVKAKKIGESEDGYYLEFELTESQKQQFIIDLIVEHSVNGTLQLRNDSDEIGHMKFLREVLNDNPTMPEELRQQYLTKILELANR